MSRFTEIDGVLYPDQWHVSNNTMTNVEECEVKTYTSTCYDQHGNEYWYTVKMDEPKTKGGWRPSTAMIDWHMFMFGMFSAIVAFFVLFYKG